MTVGSQSSVTDKDLIKAKTAMYDELEFQEYLAVYKMQTKQKALVQVEAKKAFHIIKAWQHESSRAMRTR